MYDIYFDLNNMHQTVEESDNVRIESDETDLDDEFWQIADQMNFDFIDETKEDDYPVIVKRSSKRKSNGCTCDKCGEIYPYAEPNQSDGTFKCWSCRNF